MNILEITVRADIGGGPKHVLDLLKSFDGTDTQCFIAAPRDGEYAVKLEKLSKNKIEIPFRRFSIISFFKLIILCRREKIKIIHSHGRGAGIYSRFMKLFGYKVVHTFHGVHIENSMIGKVKLLLDKFLINLTDEFICVSETEKKTALKHKIAVADKLNVIHNGVELREVKIKKISNKMIIGTLSRLNYQKGLDILIKYFSKLELEHPELEYECLVAGDGELKDELKKLNLTNKLHFIGNVEPTSFLDDIDVYISFARWEGLPIAVLEAMSAQKICFVSSVEGNIDLINDSNGFLFDLKDYESFKEQFLMIYKNRYELNEYSEKARKTIEDFFTLEQMSKKTLLVYEKCRLKT